MECPTLRFICYLILFTSLGFQNSNGQSNSFQMYHKYSQEVKEWMALKHGIDTDGWPVQGSNEYYKALHHHDSARHGRKLTEYSSLTFSEGNETLRLSQLGYLFYTMVQVGTPNVTLLVALDTGSDVFWVPCDCQACAPTSAASYGLNGIILQTYSPSASQTSKSVACSNTLCQLTNKCSKPSDQCPYSVQYLSANTSTAGTLVEDILYLTPGDGSQEGTVKASITFGCGSVQTGSFLLGAAPDGLLGLGIDDISVPSMLYSSGLVSNSFSMCFPDDSNVGRFAFGDKGSSDQNKTPFYNTSSSAYNVNVTDFYVGNTNIKTDFQALFDTGTSFTQLADPVYKNLTSNYHMQTQNSPLAVDNSSIPFEFCYSVSNSQSINQGPNISFNFYGGNNFPVIQPLISLLDTNGNLVGYCLAVLNGASTTIIGQNFMTGYQLVFDREQSLLGWKEANCYDLTYNNSLANSPSKQAVPSANDANHLSLFFLDIALSFLFLITILTILF